MFSTHHHLGFPIYIEWIESSPNDWKITAASAVKPKNQSESDYPPELEKRVKDIDNVLGQWINGYVQDLPVDLIDEKSQNLTDTSLKVLHTLYDEVKRGSVITYQELGVKSGLGPRAARPVGNVMARNPWPWFYPCHRVLPSSMKVGNYSMVGGPSVKEMLLKKEGIKIENGICKA